jgi:VIT1/CCC1 family predicted Fe2+/Mn2+ transporter
MASKQQSEQIHLQQEQAGSGKAWGRYLPEFVYGGIDGSVTTFAVVAGAAGAGLEGNIVLILGFANLIADGFSMSVGSYLSAKSALDMYDKHRKREYWEIENLREFEVEEIREIYAAKGFEGALLEQVVAKITEDKDRWVDVMMKEELEMIPEAKSPLATGTATYISFFAVGLLPLIIFVLDYLIPISGNLYFIASLITLTGFIGIGYFKSYVTETGRIRAIGETALLGVFAALLAYAVGDFLEKIIL